MKTLNIKISGVGKATPTLMVDGAIVPCKQNAYGSLQASVQTEKDIVQVAIFRDMELGGRWWWLFALISFLASVFGIFQPRYDRKAFCYHCVFNFHVSQSSDIKLRLNPLAAQGKAAMVETMCQFDVVENKFFVDKTAKRRWIILFVTKLLVWVALAFVVGNFITKLSGGGL